MKSLGLCAALCLCGALALPPVAEAAGNRRCTQTMVTDKPESNPGYKSCLSFERGRLGSGRDLERLEDASGFQWKSLGLSTDPDFGPFAADPAGQASGMLQLKELREDVFAIGLQAVIEVDAAEEFLFYIFDYSKIAGTQSIAFDTLGFDDLPGPILQAAGVFTPLVEGPPPPPPPPPPGGVPEPGSLMLTFAGLCALAVRRRRGDA